MSVFKFFKDPTFYFSHSLKTPIYEEKVLLGHLSDYFVDYEDSYPQVLAIQLKKNKQYFYIPWENIKFFSLKKIILEKDSELGRSRTFPKIKHVNNTKSIFSAEKTSMSLEYPGLGKLILDKQIVDTDGKKVVRVNDIQFIKVGKNLKVTHAAIGLRSILRRLELDTFIDFIIKFFKPNSSFLTNEMLINWKYVHAIPNKNFKSNLKLNLENVDITRFHPADLADILEDLDSHGRDVIFSNLDREAQAETLSEVDSDIQTQILKNENPEDAALIIEKMGTDEAADILSELTNEEAINIISNIQDGEIQGEIKGLLEYDDDTAGGIMSTEVFTIKKSWKSPEVLNFIKENDEEIESIYDIYIVDDEENLQGALTLRSLLVTDPNLSVENFMNEFDIKSLTPSTHWKDVAIFMSKYNLINVPIVNDNNQLVGIVSVDDILPWLLGEKA